LKVGAKQNSFPPTFAMREKMMGEHLIIRNEVSDNFSVLPNHLMNDERLSADELGLLVYLLSKPNDWRVQTSQLQARFGIGRDKTKRIIRQLEQYGYIAKDLQRAEGGQFAANRYIVSDSPLTENPSTEKPLTDNPSLTKNRDIQNTESTNQEGSSVRKKYSADDISLTDERRAYAEKYGLDADELIEDIRIWAAKRSRKAVYASLDAFWQSWVRREAKGALRASTGQQSVSDKKLTEKQQLFAERMAEQLWRRFKGEGFMYEPILKDVLAFIATDQTDADWMALGNGLPRPF
jgi:hypothetical protein